MPFRESEEQLRRQEQEAAERRFWDNYLYQKDQRAKAFRDAAQRDSDIWAQGRARGASGRGGSGRALLVLFLLGGCWWLASGPVTEPTARPEADLTQIPLVGAEESPLFMAALWWPAACAMEATDARCQKLLQLVRSKEYRVLTCTYQDGPGSNPMHYVFWHGSMPDRADYPPPSGATHPFLDLGSLALAECPATEAQADDLLMQSRRAFQQGR